MADNLARAQLARAALRLGGAMRRDLPPLILLTDAERLPDPAGAVGGLPRGSLVILRARDRARRLALIGLIAPLCRARGLEWIISEDASLAAECGASGAHFPERTLALAARWRRRRPQWLLTCAAHSLRACIRAAGIGADAVLLSPVFATASHPGRPCLGGLRTRMVARTVAVPIYALGGVDALRARRLAGSRLAGLAAIGALAGDSEGMRTVARPPRQTYKLAGGESSAALPPEKHRSKA